MSGFVGLKARRVTFSFEWITTDTETHSTSWTWLGLGAIQRALTALNCSAVHSAVSTRIQELSAAHLSVSCINRLSPRGHIHTVSHLNSSGHYMYHQFNILQFYVLPTHCIYVFCVDMRTNSDYFPIQH